MSARARQVVEPRLLGREAAADYCSLSVPVFTSACPVVPIKIRSRVLYDRQKIDEWVDALSGSKPKLVPREELLRRLDDADAHKRG